jgi:competence protein ComEC
MERWPLNKAHFWERAPFFKLLLPLVTGIFLYPYWKVGNTVVLFTALFAYLLFIAAAIYKTQSSVRRLATFFSLHAFFLLVAFSLCYFNDITSRRDWFGHTVNAADLSLVRIMETPVAKETTWKLQVEVLQTVLPQQVLHSAGKALVYVYKDKNLPAIAKGDTLLLPNKWQPVTNAGNPFEFDYAGYCRRNNIHYTQFVGPKDLLLYGRSDPADLAFTERMHDRCMNTLQRYIGDKRALGLVQSMLIGDEVNLDNDIRQAFTETGIVHVIAISGGNIAMLFMVILFLLRCIRHKKYLWLKYIIALPVVWCYVMMAGSSPSAVRAALMFSLLAFGFVLQNRKDTNGLNQLFATAFILLIAQPMWLYAIGFQLSFVAVLSLMLFYRHIYRWYAPTNRVSKALWSTIAASVAAEILIGPLVVYYFHTFPLFFIISNVVAYLLMGLVLLLGMSVIAISFVPAIAKLLGLVTVWTVTAFNYIIGILRGWEPARLHLLRLTAVELVLMYLLVCFAAIFFLQKNKRAAIAGLAAACLLIASFCVDRYNDLRQQMLVVYNVGKGHHIEMISGDTHSVLATDTFALGKKEYVVKPAHIGWQALKEKKSGQRIFSVNGKTAVILKERLLPGASAQHIDVVIIAYAVRLEELKRIREAFTPEKVILSYSLPGNRLDDWKIVSGQMGIDLHPVQEGAFIME